MWAPTGNWVERNRILSSISDITRKLARTRGLIHRYVSERHYELRYSRITSDVFSRIRQLVDDKIGSSIPDSAAKFTAVYDNLSSENPEDWANAVHSCRRILQDLADALFPAQNEDRVVEVDGKKISVKLGKDQYINRLMNYVADKSDSETFIGIVGANLDVMGKRLDALFKAAQKGSHSKVSREEADRYVVYTYMIVGDILSLAQIESAARPAEDTGRIEIVEFSDQLIASEAARPKKRKQSGKQAE